MNAKENLPKMFHSQGDKNAEIIRLETMIAAWDGNPRVKESVRRLAKARLRIVRGLQVRT